jgi:hypothetical protein
MTKPFIVTGQIEAALKTAGKTSIVELREPGLSNHGEENPDIIRLGCDYYLAIEPDHPDTPMIFSVSLNESMYAGGDVLYKTWVVDGARKESITPVVDEIRESISDHDAK